MQSEKSLGPNGLPVEFFKVFWEIIAEYVTKAMEEVRLNGRILRALSHTFLAKIPKGEDAENIANIRPIALCNVFYKILTKLMAERLKKILPTIISQEQGGFVQDWRILDSIILPQEYFHTLTRKVNKECS